MSWSTRKACCCTASSPPPTFRIATAALSCWRHCSACFPFSGNCSPTALIKARSFTAPWPPSCPISRPRSSNDPTTPRASSSSPGAGLSNGRSPGSTAAGDWPRTGKTSTATRSPSSSSPQSASCSENSVILHKVSGRTLKPKFLHFARLRIYPAGVRRLGLGLRQERRNAATEGATLTGRASGPWSWAAGLNLIA